MENSLVIQLEHNNRTYNIDFLTYMEMEEDELTTYLFKLEDNRLTEEYQLFLQRA